MKSRLESIQAETESIRAKTESILPETESISAILESKSLKWKIKNGIRLFHALMDAPRAGFP